MARGPQPIPVQPAPAQTPMHTMHMAQNKDASGQPKVGTGMQSVTMPRYGSLYPLC